MKANMMIAQCATTTHNTNEAHRCRPATFRIQSSGGSEPASPWDPLHQNKIARHHNQTNPLNHKHTTESPNTNRQTKHVTHNILTNCNPTRTRNAEDGKKHTKEKDKTPNADSS